MAQPKKEKSFKIKMLELIKSKGERVFVEFGSFSYYFIFAIFKGDKNIGVFKIQSEKKLEEIPVFSDASFIESVLPALKEITNYPFNENYIIEVAKDGLILLKVNKKNIKKLIRLHERGFSLDKILQIIKRKNLLTIIDVFENNNEGMEKLLIFLSL